MPTHTPSGSLRVYANAFFSGTCMPVSVAAAPAKYSMQSAPLWTSTTSASCSGLPQSATSSAASSSLRARSSTDARCRMRPRSVAVMADQVSKPRCAAATAASTSALSASCTTPIRAPVAGLMLSNAAPPPTQGWPSTKPVMWGVSIVCFLLFSSWNRPMEATCAAAAGGARGLSA